MRMLESLLSKFVLGVCAIMVFALVSSGFASTQDEVDDRLALGTLGALSDLIGSVGRANEPVSFRFDLLPSMCPGFDRLEIASGSISMVSEGGRLSVEIPGGLLLLSGAHAVDSCEKLEVWPPASIVIERRSTSLFQGTVIYVENLDATSVTSSANLSHSLGVL